MITIINESKDPRFNLALEEYALKNLEIDDDIILLWQNAPSIIVGRNQNTVEEINATYVKKHDIHVVRRISGGGAVYHDFGNLNFTFITTNHRDNLNNFKKFSTPVINALQSLGVPAEFSGRNDILVDGKKFSGNAQSYHGNRMFQHGTILYDVDLEMVGKTLHVRADKIESKGIKSVRSRVTNILPYMTEKMDITTFKGYLLKYFLDTDDVDSKTYHLNEYDLMAIKKLSEEKYGTWAWNFGESPQFNIQKSNRYLGGNVNFNINVKDGLITECKIFGDFFGERDIKDLEEVLIGNVFKEDVLYEVLKQEPIDEYFFNIFVDDLINCIFY